MKSIRPVFFREQHLSRVNMDSIGIPCHEDVPVLME